MKRYFVQASDTCGSVENAIRDRQWDVIDRQTGHCVANHDRRDDARTEANERNKHDFLARAGARAVTLSDPRQFNV